MSQAHTIQTTLPYSGKAVTLRRVTARDMVEAELLVEQAGGGKDIAHQMALISRVALIDGQALPYQDFLELDATDVQFLGKLDPNPAKPPSAPPPAPPPAQSSPSPEPPAGAGPTSAQ